LLYLVFHVGHDRFAIETAHVVEVLPLVYWKGIPEARESVTGLLNYHRQVVPLLDFTLRVTGQPSHPRMSTRIFMARVPAYDPEVLSLSSNGETPDGETPFARDLLGIIVERVSGTLRCDPSAFTPPPTIADTAPWLGPVLTDAQGIIQRVDIDHLLTAPVHR